MTEKNKVSNGELMGDDLTDSEKLDVILSALIDVSQELELVKVNQEELLEKLSNFELPGGSFGIERYGES